MKTRCYRFTNMKVRITTKLIKRRCEFETERLSTNERHHRLKQQQSTAMQLFILDKLVGCYIHCLRRLDYQAIYSQHLPIRNYSPLSISLAITEMAAAYSQIYIKLISGFHPAVKLFLKTDACSVYVNKQLTIITKEICTVKFLSTSSCLTVFTWVFSHSIYYFCYTGNIWICDL